MDLCVTSLLLFVVGDVQEKLVKQSSSSASVNSQNSSGNANLSPKYTWLISCRSGFNVLLFSFQEYEVFVLDRQLLITKTDSKDKCFYCTFQLWFQHDGPILQSILSHDSLYDIQNCELTVAKSMEQ